MSDGGVPDCPDGTSPNHDWEPLAAAIEGRESLTTYVVYQCGLCDDLKIDHGPEVISEEGEPYN